MKKGLSILLALTLLVSILVPVPVLGTSGDVGKTTVITVTGGITTIGTYGQVLGGVLPTTTNLDFTIDPMNLAGLQNNDIVDKTATNSAVTFENNLLRAWNTSSVPVLLTANLQVVTTGNPSAITVTNEAAVTNGDTANILLWAQPNATIQNTNDATFSGAGQVIPFGTAAQTRVDFRLPARPHVLRVVDKDATPIEVALSVADGAPALNGTSFAFGGIINVKNDEAVAAWSKVETIGINATFTMTALLDIPDNAAARAAAYRTDGDVTPIAGGMLASYGTYVAPPLIALPEGGGASGGSSNVINATVGTAWVNVPGVVASPAFVTVGPAGEEILLASGDQWRMNEGQLQINLTGWPANEYRLSVFPNAENLSVFSVFEVKITAA